MSTETPRTDRMIRRRDEIAACEVVAADLARTIERELTAAQQEIERLQALILRISEAYDATIAEQAKEIERLREALRSLVKHGGPVIEYKYKCGTVVDGNVAVGDLSSSVTFPAARVALAAARRALGEEGKV